VSIYISQAVN